MVTIRLCTPVVKPVTSLTDQLVTILSPNLIITHTQGSILSGRQLMLLIYQEMKLKLKYFELILYCNNWIDNLYKCQITCDNGQYYVHVELTTCHFCTELISKYVL
jgi:hypothetical protein